MQISSHMQDLYRRLVAIDHAEKDIAGEEEKVRVDDVLSRLALFYEKLRNTMDYHEDHLLRRFAIERDIRRRIVLETLSPKHARHMVEGLIRSGYMSNDAVAESAVSDIAAVMNKYAYLLERIGEEVADARDRRRITKWIIGIVACEIDLQLVNEHRLDALIEALYSIVCDRIKIKGEQITDREKNIQLYITLHKALVRSDDPIISLHLLQLYFPDWATADKRLVEFVASKITSIYHGVHTHLNNRIRTRLLKGLRSQITVFKVLKELVIQHHGSLTELLSNPEFFEQEAREMIQKLSRTMKQKIRRSSIRAIIYIFITKVGLALALEYPFDVYVVGEVNYTALTINILFPPILMFFVTLSARMPGDSNAAALLAELQLIVYGDPGKELMCEIKTKKFQGPVYFAFEYLFYMLLYGLIFGLIAYILQWMNFSVLSGAVFIFFVTAVSFFGTRIRQLAREYDIESKREGMRHMLIIFLSLPIIRAGHWLSFNLRRINLFTFILDFIIEAPFKLLVELIESWFGFLREKKEDTIRNA